MTFLTPAQLVALTKEESVLGDILENLPGFGEDASDGPNQKCVADYAKGGTVLGALAGVGSGIVAPDGTTTISAPDGTTATIATDGTVTTTSNDGTTTTNAPDGTVTTTTPDGTTTTTTPDGTTTTTEPDPDHPFGDTGDNFPDPDAAGGGGRGPGGPVSLGAYAASVSAFPAGAGLSGLVTSVRVGDAYTYGIAGMPQLASGGGLASAGILAGAS